METMTITEALSEINLVQKKIQKKQETVLANLVKPKHVKDQLEAQGGSKQFIQSEVQAVSDLTRRLVMLRGSIAKANIENSITVSGKTDTIHNWLTWKRDVAQKQIDFYNKTHITVKHELDKLMRQPQVYKDDAGTTHLLEVEPNVEYGDYVKKAEETQEAFDKLDGQLSLKNATITVTI